MKKQDFIEVIEAAYQDFEENGLEKELKANIERWRGIVEYGTNHIRYEFCPFAETCDDNKIYCQGHPLSKYQQIDYKDCEKSYKTASLWWHGQEKKKRLWVLDHWVLPWLRGKK
jgi:hypothetical protein